MRVESELRKLLEQNGYELKEEDSFTWGYKHPKHKTIINYSRYKNENYIWFNALTKLMRDEVEKTHGKGYVSSNFQEREFFYREALSKFSFYENIKDNIEFPPRKNGKEYVGISENVGIDVLSLIFKSITSEPEKLPARQVVYIKNHIPGQDEFEEAYREIAPSGEEISIDRLLDQIKKNCVSKGYVLDPNWRSVTEKNILEERWGKDRENNGLSN
jgi:hypothetical protein